MTKVTEPKANKPQPVREPTLQEYLDGMWQIIDPLPAPGPDHRHVETGYKKLSAFIKKHDKANAALKKKAKTKKPRRKQKSKGRNK